MKALGGRFDDCVRIRNFYIRDRLKLTIPPLENTRVCEVLQVYDQSTQLRIYAFNYFYIVVHWEG